ncbi:MAG: hypothetical protein ACJ8AD_01735 [Gemmatimonadaceae bacterium]
MMNRLLGLLAIVGLTACSSHSMPVLLQGEPVAAASLSGDWTGSYWNGGSARRGALKFYIGKGEDDSFGDVTMLSPLGERMQPADQGPAHRAHTRLAQTLRVDFDWAPGGQLTGSLEPYIAPDCLCKVTTTFTGTFVGDTIRGTFVTTGGTTENREGKWQLVRRTAIKR